MSVSSSENINLPDLLEEPAEHHDHRTINMSEAVSDMMDQIKKMKITVDVHSQEIVTESAILKAIKKLSNKIDYLTTRVDSLENSQRSHKISVRMSGDRSAPRRVAFAPPASSSDDDD
jgi:hypothetical protein